MSAGTEVSMTEVADGVHLVTGTHTNWVLVVDGDELTLVDAGYPKDGPKVEASLQRLGKTPADVTTVLLTHAHPDHIGISEQLRAEHGTPVRVFDDEVPHARGERIEQIREVDIARQLWRPKTARWVFDIVRAGGPNPTRLKDVVAFSADGPLEVPGRPVPIPTPGHTTGHCAFHLPERGVLIAGDALMTDHLMARSPGPQLLPSPFNADDERALASLAALEPLDATVVIPGHGPAFSGTPADAVQAARGHRR